jgi:hypothetical protein
MDKIYYNGSTQKKRIIVSKKDLHHLYKVKFQDWDSQKHGFVTRDVWHCKEIAISKKAKTYSTSRFDEDGKPFTEYYTSSGIKIFRDDNATIYVKQVGEK